MKSPVSPSRTHPSLPRRRSRYLADLVLPSGGAERDDRGPTARARGRIAARVASGQVAPRRRLDRPNECLNVSRKDGRHSTVGERITTTCRSTRRLAGMLASGRRPIRLGIVRNRRAGVTSRRANHRARRTRNRDEEPQRKRASRRGRRSRESSVRSLTARLILERSQESSTGMAERLEPCAPVCPELDRSRHRRSSGARRRSRRLAAIEAHWCSTRAPSSSTSRFTSRRRAGLAFRVCVPFSVRVESIR